MIRRPPRSTRTYTLFPYTTRFRSTAPVSTSTVKAGAPDDIKITKDGSIKPTGGTAVTIDSDHKVVNDGTLQIGNANGATGIFAEAGVTGSITHSATGKIVDRKSVG